MKAPVYPVYQLPFKGEKKINPNQGGLVYQKKLEKGITLKTSLKPMGNLSPDLMKTSKQIEFGELVFRD